jgi:hypothetical protein
VQIILKNLLTFQKNYIIFVPRGENAFKNYYPYADKATSGKYAEMGTPSRSQWL